MAIPTFVATSGASASTTDLTLDVPTGTQDDDLMLMLLETLSGEAVAAPSGWTEAPSSPQDAGGTTTRLTVFYRVADSEPADYTVSDPGDHVAGAIATYRGAGSSSPFNANAGETEDGSGSTATFPSVTTTQDDCLIVHLASSDRDAVSSFLGAITNANLSDLTERVDRTFSEGGGGGVGAIDGGLATAGSTGETSVSSTLHARGLITLALAPELKIQPDGVASSFTAGTAQVNRTLPTTGVASTLAFGTAQLNRTLPVQGVASSLAFGTASANLSISATGVASTLAFGTAFATASIGPAGVASTLAFGAGQLNLTVQGAAVASTLAFGTTGIGNLQGGGFHQNANEPAENTGDGASFFNTHTGNSGDKAGFYGG